MKMGGGLEGETGKFMEKVLLRMDADGYILIYKFTLDYNTIESPQYGLDLRIGILVRLNHTE